MIFMHIIMSIVAIRPGKYIQSGNCTHRQYRFQNRLEMEKHPRCSVKTLMHAKNA